MEELRNHAKFWSGILKGRDHSDGLGVDGSIILRWILRIGYEDMDWVHVAQNKDKWWNLVNTIMNLRVA
jgi:hypothetical protein